MSVQSTTLKRLVRALCEVLGRELVLEEQAFAARLDRIGLDSVAMLSFLVAIEDEFGIEWSDETPQATLQSLQTIAEHVDRELSDAS